MSSGQDIDAPPPRCFIAALVQLVVMKPADGNREL
jgi:hypothetical protein